MSYNKLWEKEQDKLNNVERIKLNKDGLDVITTIVEKYADGGFDAVSEEDRVLLKWAGIYDQKPRAGYYMMRVRINSGIINTEQVRVIAEISHKYGKDIIKITSRGAIQFYWITLNQLPSIFEKFEKVGLSTFEACGDCPRTIVGNPLTGIDRHELMDTSDLVEELNQFFLLNRDFSNLPRKLKLSISSSIYNPAHKEINDISFTPAVKMIDGEERIGFHLSVGGGLSVSPHLAKQLDLFVKPEEVVKVAEGVATIFRDHGYREKRNHARLKFLVNDWGIEKFKNELLKLTGPLEEKGMDKSEEWNGAYYYGIHPQRQEGLNYLGLHIPLGHMDSKAMLTFADLADQYGDSKLRTTMSQNMILSGVKETDLPELLKNPIFENYPVDTNSFLKHMVVCTGSEFCNLALVETKERAKNIAKHLDQHIDKLPLRINIVGCPNSCGHALIADIGLRGCLVKTDGGSEEAFDLFIGGVLGEEARFGTKLQGRILAGKINYVLLHIAQFFQNSHKEGEVFPEFVNRMGIPAFQGIINEYIN